MNNNFKSIIFLAGHFGVVIREHIEQLVYRNKYGKISANVTLSKLEKQYNMLKRIDRGKRKSDAYRLTNEGIKYFRHLFGYEPKVFNSGDKLSHSIHILNFYCTLIKDMLQRRILNDKINIIEDSRKIRFDVHKYVRFMGNKTEKEIIMDSFVMYRYSEKRGIVFHLEIENSDRRSSLIAQKTVENYEEYFKSKIWEMEYWQPKNTKIFPPILIVTYSEHKMEELIRWIRKKMSIELRYYFITYKLLQEKGISGEVWKDINNNKIRLLV